MEKQLIGVWQNQNGSQFKITQINPNGTFEGEYRTAVGKADLKHFYHANGTFSQNEKDVKSLVVCFFVNWGEAHSIAAWNGYFIQSEKGKRLSTQWLLARSTNALNFWDGIHAGHDEFVPET